jgi:hypothetical protein
VNPYPARVVVANDERVEPVVVEMTPPDGDVPPPESYVTANVLAVHRANNVKSPV